LRHAKRNGALSMCFLSRIALGKRPVPRSDSSGLLYVPRLFFVDLWLQ
jgi:hypothetical protein